MPGKTKSSKPTARAACHGTDLVRRIATYPVLLTGQLAGKRINVGRVTLYECQTCGHLMPTPAGQARWTVTSTWVSSCSLANCPDQHVFQLKFVYARLPEAHDSLPPFAAGCGIV